MPEARVGRTGAGVCDIDEVVRAIAGPAAPLHIPEFSGNEWRYVKDCLDSGGVSSVGNHVTRLEEEVADFLGVEHAVATVSGTIALYAASSCCQR